VSGKSKYPEQFRKDAVALARSSDRPLRQVEPESASRVWGTISPLVKAGDRLRVALPDPNPQFLNARTTERS
jgi:transposase